MLGYTPDSWDNVSGDELQPWSSIKHWTHLTTEEKAAARVLGYTIRSWNGKKGNEEQPASTTRFFADLSSCPDGKNIRVLPSVVPL